MAKNTIFKGLNSGFFQDSQATTLRLLIVGGSNKWVGVGILGFFFGNV